LGHVLAPTDSSPERAKYAPLVSLIAGTTIGAALLGAAISVAWFVTSSFDAVRIGLLLGIVPLCVLGMIWPAVRRWLPERACQVPGALMMVPRPSSAALKWGIQLGTGVRTFVVTPAFYVLLAVALSEREAWFPGLVCIAYGVARGATIAFFAFVTALRKRAGGRRLAGAHLEVALRIPLLLVIATTTYLLIV
jgi:hypothetical protein